LYVSILNEISFVRIQGKQTSFEALI
jgi:hypothetical protein